MSSSHDVGSCPGGKSVEDFSAMVEAHHTLSFSHHGAGTEVAVPADAVTWFSICTAPWPSCSVLGLSWFSLFLGSFSDLLDIFLPFWSSLFHSAAQPSPALKPRGKKANRGPQPQGERSGVGRSRSRVEGWSTPVRQGSNHLCSLLRHCAPR